MYDVFELENDVLSENHKHRGPPTKVKKASEDFLEHWKENEFGEPFEEDGYWYVISPRPIRSATEFLEKQTENAGIGRNIDPSTKVVYDHVQTFNVIDTGLLTELLDPKYPWEN